MQKRSRASVLTDRIDWNSIVQSATRHGIAPLVYRTLSRIDNDSAVPPEVRATLRTAYYNNIARNMLLYKERQTVLKAFKFRAAGIAVIVLILGAHFWLKSSTKISGYGR